MITALRASLVALCVLGVYGIASEAKLPPGALPGPYGAWFRRQVSDYSQRNADTWLDRQRNVQSGSCCGVADGHRLDDNQFRIVAGPPDSRGDMTGQYHPDPNPDGTGVAFEVNIDGHWLPVLYSMLVKLWDTDPNPTGQAVVWYSYDSTARTAANPGGVRIWCFAPGSMS